MDIHQSLPALDIRLRWTSNKFAGVENQSEVDTNQILPAVDIHLRWIFTNVVGGGHPPEVDIHQVFWAVDIHLTPGAYTEKRRADFSKFEFVLIQIDIKMMKNGI